MSCGKPLVGERKEQLQQFVTELLGQELNCTQVYHCLPKTHLKLLQLYHM